MSAKLLAALYRAQTKDEMLKALRDGTGQAGVQFIPLNEQANNCFFVEVAAATASTIIEGCTNGLDACIVQHRETIGFKVPPTSPLEAMTAVGETGVHVHVQHRGRKKPTVTIIDQGTGMSEEGMKRGVLASGSTAKPCDPMQHGNFGIGGASLFGKSGASLIVTRRPGDDHYCFTVVYKLKRTDGPAGYVYAARQDKSLFVAPAKSLAAIAPDSPHVDSAVKLGHMVLPLHGTIRRQVEMDVDYSRGRQSSFYRALTTRLFGTTGQVTVIGDNEVRLPITGLRNDLNRLQVGDTVGNDPSGPVLLGHIPAKSVVLPTDVPLTVGIETWAISDFIAASGNRTTFQRDRFEGRSGDAVAGIIVTLNGQMHARLLSGKLLRDAGLPYLAEHLVINVTLDSVPVEHRDILLTSTREHLTKIGEDFVRQELDAYVRAHESLSDLNARLTPAVQKDAGESSVNIASQVNRMLSNPLLGGILRTQSVKQVRANEGAERPSNVVSFIPSDNPDLLSITTSGIHPGKTCWIAVRTNAPDHLATKVRIEVPDFLTEIMPSKPVGLQDGRMVVSYQCGDVPVGTAGIVFAILQLDDGSRLTATRAIEVTEKLAKPRQTKPKQPKPDSNATVPTVYYREIGCDDAEYLSVYPGVDDEVPAWNWSYAAAENALTIFLNPGFEPLYGTRQTLACESLQLADVFMTHVKLGLTAHAMVAVRDTDNFGPGGAGDAGKLRLLADFCRAMVIVNTSLCRDEGYKTMVEQQAIVTDLELAEAA